MSRFNPIRILSLSLVGAAVLTGTVQAQALPPPGVDAARPPTERTLRPSGKAQNRDRVVLSQDCHKVESEMREQFRIQADSVRSQYAVKIQKAPQSEQAALGKERDGKLRELQAEGESAAKQFGDNCRVGNKALLRAPVSPGDPR